MLQILKNSVFVGFFKRKLNFIAGTNITLTITDDSVNKQIDVTIAASGGSGSGLAQFQVRQLIRR